MASMLSWNQTVQLLCTKVPTKLLGWAPASYHIPINPAAWLAVLTPVLPLLLKTKEPRADHPRGALVVPLVDDKRDRPALDVDI
jgi:hypothetical protein